MEARLAMEFETRCTLEAGNVLLTYNKNEDLAAVNRGYEFIGVGRDDAGREVHVFRATSLEPD
jgi:hypothetical protein